MAEPEDTHVSRAPSGSTEAELRIPAHVDVCFDTNVVLEISTIVDLNRAAGAGRLIIATALATRRSRARASLAAAWLCHKRGLTSFSLRHELEEQLRKLAPARTPDGDHVWFFTWFLKDYVLPSWTFSTSEDPQVSDEWMKGNARDRHLASLAKDHNAHLVSHERTPKGALARAAAASDMTVMSPKSWVEMMGGDVHQLAKELLEVTRDRMLEFICDRREFDAQAQQNCQAFVQLLELVLDNNLEPTLPDPMDGWHFWPTT